MKRRQPKLGATKCVALCHPTCLAWTGALHLSQSRTNIRRDGKAEVLDIEIKGLDKNSQENVLQSSWPLTPAWIIERHHPVLNIHPQTAR